jgi:hypothetical protein
VLDEFLSHIEPPLDPSVYRVGFGFIHSAYFFLKDMLYYVQYVFLGTAKGLESIEPMAVRSITDISLISDMYRHPREMALWLNLIQTH